MGRHVGKKEQWLGQDYKGVGVGPRTGADRSWGKRDRGDRRKEEGGRLAHLILVRAEGATRFPQRRVRGRSILC